MTNRYHHDRQSSFYQVWDSDTGLNDEATVSRLNAQASEINELRAQLDAAHQHVGALIAIKHGIVLDWAEMQADDATIDAARAFLRRAMPKGQTND